MLFPPRWSDNGDKLTFASGKIQIIQDRDPCGSQAPVTFWNSRRSFVSNIAFYKSIRNRSRPFAIMAAKRRVEEVSNNHHDAQCDRSVISKFIRLGLPARRSRVSFVFTMTYSERRAHSSATPRGNETRHEGWAHGWQDQTFPKQDFRKPHRSSRFRQITRDAGSAA